MQSLKPYPSYRESGVPWLGKVPVHWEVCALRRQLRTLDGIKIGPFGSQLKLEQLSPYGFKVFGQSNVIEKDFSLGKKFIHERKFNELSAYALLPGDLAVTMMGTTGKCVRVPEDAVLGIMDSHLLRLRVGRNVDGEFIARLIDEAPYIEEQLEVAGKGSIMHGLNSSIVKSLVFAVPPLPEQAAVVRFLDHADRRIRRFNRAKNKLIALLDEQKQAVIHQAVTGRIDVRTGQPYPAYKPSGVERLGDVPDHWEVQRLGHLASKFGSGVTPRGGATVYQESGVPFLRSQNVHFGGLRMEDVARIPESLHRELSGSQVKAGDVLLNITGASIGRSCSVPNNLGEGNVNQHVCIIRTSQSCILPEFLVSYLSTPHMQREIQFEQSGASREGLTLQSIRDFRVVVPPILEQAPIVKYIGEATANIATIVGRTRSEIDLASEYQTRLIADVVTGKLDVRKAAAALPDEPDDPDVVEVNCPETEGGDDGRRDRDQRTAVPATQAEITP